MNQIPMSVNRKKDFDIIEKMNNSLSNNVGIENELLIDDDIEEVKEVNTKTTTLNSNEEVLLNEEEDLKVEEVLDEETQFSDEICILKYDDDEDLKIVEETRENDKFDKDNSGTLDKKSITIEIHSSSEDEESEIYSSKDYICKFCSLAYNKREEMQEHIKAIHGNFNFDYTQNVNMNAFVECLKNEKKQTDISGGEEQSSTKCLDGEEYEKSCRTLFTPKSECTICKKIFFTNFASTNTVQTICSKCQYYKRNNTCNLCSKTMYFRSLPRHMASVHGQENLVCEFCYAQFKCREYLMKHLKQIHYPKTKLPQKIKLSCQKCSKVFIKEKTLKTHMQKCLGNSIICEICHVFCVTLAMLKKHMKAKHSNVEGPEQKHKIHRKIQEPEKLQEPLDQCVYCGKWFVKSLFRVHVKECIKKKIQVSVTVDEIDLIDVEG